MSSWQLLADEKLEDSDIESAPKLIEAVLQNCRGRVDQWLEPYLRISIERLRKTKKNYLKDLLVNVVRYCLKILDYYSCLGLSVSLLLPCMWLSTSGAPGPPGSVLAPPLGRETRTVLIARV